jgi:hypothetical protein
MFLYLNILSNRIGGVVDSMLASSAVGRELKPGRVIPKTITLVCVAKHAALSRKSEDWLARNQYNVSELSDMYIRGLVSMS